MGIVRELELVKQTPNYAVYSEGGNKEDRLIINDPYIRKEDISVDGKVPHRIEISVRVLNLDTFEARREEARNARG